MNRDFIADASVAVGWVHPAQATIQTAAMLQEIEQGATLEVPALWPVEVANALAVLVRRRKLTGDECRTALGWLRGLRLRIDHEMASLAFSRLSELATTHQLTVYDAAYLELGQRWICGSDPRSNRSSGGQYTTDINTSQRVQKLRRAQI